MGKINTPMGKREVPKGYDALIKELIGLINFFSNECSLLRKDVDELKGRNSPASPAGVLENLCVGNYSPHGGTHDDRIY